MNAVPLKQVVEALREVSCSFYFPELQRLADSIELHGIAPPDGWVLVPKEPTQEMLSACMRDCSGIGRGSYGEGSGIDSDDVRSVWETMLAAAPGWRLRNEAD